MPILHVNTNEDELQARTTHIAGERARSLAASPTYVHLCSTGLTSRKEQVGYKLDWLIKQGLWS
uniref:Uncharacterized protein n=1 Tax=Oryza brachyantha TaxID=4533 RepID=J3L223_ORYBR